MPTSTVVVVVVVNHTESITINGFYIFWKNGRERVGELRRELLLLLLLLLQENGSDANLKSIATTTVVGDTQCTHGTLRGRLPLLPPLPHLSFSIFAIVLLSLFLSL